ncbi:MAG: N-6 DNA methylase [bacterium]
MFEQSFKNIDNILHTDSGCGTELDYVEQTSWILFLKYLDDLEEDKKKSAALSGKSYEYILSPEYRWNVWACPKNPSTSSGQAPSTSSGQAPSTSSGQALSTSSGQALSTPLRTRLDHNKALDGDDLKDFVNNKLFPYLKKFKAEDPNTIEYKIGEIFSELKNKIFSGYKLREILNVVDEMHFRLYEEKHELSHLYEAKIKNMGNAGRNGGEYYTPRPLIKTIIKVVDPKIGQTIYDGACGSAGFLVEAYKYLTENQSELSSSQMATLQTKTFYGKEIKSLAYIIGIMNMILHGIEAPNIQHYNTLKDNINDIQEKDRYDIILANPPFGAGIGREIQQNFPIKTGETAFLFLQHFIKILKAGGKAGIVIKNTFLSNTDNASVSLRKLLLENCNLHTVLDLPGGAFQGAGVKTVVLFFTKGESTKKVWFYQLNLARNLGKGNPLNENDLAEFVELQKIKADSANSWTIDVKNVYPNAEGGRVDQNTFDLSVKNPNKNDDVVLREPKEILEEMKKLDRESENIFRKINEII